MSNDHQPHGAGSSDDLRGLEVLLVEDSWVVGDAVKQLLELLGANVSGPAASIAEAEHLLAQHLPDVALVDFHLRGGEQSTTNDTAYCARRARYHADWITRVLSCAIGKGHDDPGETCQ